MDDPPQQDHDAQLYLPRTERALILRYLFNIELAIGLHPLNHGDLNHLFCSASSQNSERGGASILPMRVTLPGEKETVWYLDLFTLIHLEVSSEWFTTYFKAEATFSSTALKAYVRVWLQRPG